MFFRVVCRVVAFFPNVLEILTVLVNMLSGPFVSGNFPQPKTVNRWKDEMNIDERVGPSDGETAGAVGANAFCIRSMTVVRGSARDGILNFQKALQSLLFCFFLASPLHRHYGTNVVYFCICLNKKNKTAICDSPCRWSTSPGFWQTLSRWKLNRNGCDFSAYLVLKGILFVHSVGDLQCVRMCVYPCAAG